MKKYVLTGLLVWLPLAITVWVLMWVLGLLDGIFVWFLGGLGALLPDAGREAVERLSNMPGLGLVVMLASLWLTGVLATNIAGQWWLRQWDQLMQRIPVVKSIYSAVKQVSDTLFSGSGEAFRAAVLVQYPRQGVWTIAFITGKPGGEVAQLLGGDYINVYVPTTPNPTSGFFLMLPRADVIVLTMSVDEALKHIISMGVVAPAVPGEGLRKADPVAYKPTD